MLKTLERQFIDLTKNQTPNNFAYRGQFSPDLIKNILNKYVKKNTTIYDPFLGSGTVISEGLKHGCNVYGSEINPASIIISNLYKLINNKKNNDLLKKIDKYLNKKPTFTEILKKIKKSNKYEKIIYEYLFITSYKRKNKEFLKNLVKNFKKLSLIIKNFKYSSKKIQINFEDSRFNELRKDSIDYIITSPPYINVFNYHQYYREGVEKLNFPVLKIAQSEIGSNRKFRSNRFLTIIQYCLDIDILFKSFKKILKNKNLVIIIIGRESNVRGVSIKNTDFIEEIAKLNHFTHELTLERSFINKYGKKIFEDILFYKVKKIELNNSIIELKEFIKKKLQYLLRLKVKTDVKNDILSAINNLNEVKHSSKFLNEYSKTPFK